MDSKHLSIIRKQCTCTPSSYTRLHGCFRNLRNTYNKKKWGGVCMEFVYWKISHIKSRRKTVRANHSFQCDPDPRFSSTPVEVIVVSFGLYLMRELFIAKWQYQIRPWIYCSSVVTWRSNQFLEPTGTEQWEYSILVYMFILYLTGSETK